MSVEHRPPATWAVVSDDGLHRYELGRGWDVTLPLLAWVMLNPSTADHTQDDPTIRRCIGFAKTCGFGGIVVWNLYAYRATSPHALQRAIREHGEDYAIGKDNAGYLASARHQKRVVLGWGAWGDLNGRGDAVRDELLSVGVKAVHLGLTASGQPRHPLYLRGDVEPVEYPGRETRCQGCGFDEEEGPHGVGSCV